MSEYKFKTGDVIEGGRDFNVIRTIEKRIAKHLWRVHCYEPQSGRSHYCTFSTTELKEMANNFTFKPKQ